jgi:hypothetical protein
LISLGIKREQGFSFNSLVNVTLLFGLFGKIADKSSIGTLLAAKYLAANDPFSTDCLKC